MKGNTLKGINALAESKKIMQPSLFGTQLDLMAQLMQGPTIFKKTYILLENYEAQLTSPLAALACKI